MTVMYVLNLLAEEFGLPVVVHDREAHRAVLEMLSGFEGRIEGARAQEENINHV